MQWLRRGHPLAREIERSTDVLCGDALKGCTDTLLADGFGYWLAGFVDGEGCFAIYEEGTARKPYLGARFGLSLRRDDRPILEEIVDRLNVGRVRDTQRVHLGLNSTSSWLVSRHDDLAILVAIFERFPLRAKKRRDFEIWKQAVALGSVSYQGRNQGASELPEVEEHVRQMRALKAQLRAERRYYEGGADYGRAPMPDKIDRPTTEETHAFLQSAVA